MNTKGHTFKADISVLVVSKRIFLSPTKVIKLSSNFLVYVPFLAITFCLNKGEKVSSILLMHLMLFSCFFQKLRFEIPQGADIIPGTFSFEKINLNNNPSILLMLKEEYSSKHFK